VLDVVRFNFDPTVSPFGLAVRAETLALAGVIFAVLVLSGLGAGRMRARALADPGAWPADSSRLRRDDLILIAFGAVPGAVAGGRLDYGLIHYDYFGADTSRLADPGQGGLALTLAVVLGTLTALAVAALLSAPISRWLHVVSVPLLLGLGLGKLAMVLGGDGQGQWSSASWATAFDGAGPWQSANASVAAVPSQILEAILVLAAAALVLAVPIVLRLRVRRWRRLVRPGLAARREWWLLSGYRRFLAVLFLWAVARFTAAFTWRDALVQGSLRAEQVILAATLDGCAVLFVVSGLIEVRRRRIALRAAAQLSAAPASAAPDLPEPRTRAQEPVSR
jgi:prolipoprotein diacylglyceryltransferase